MRCILTILFILSQVSLLLAQSDSTGLLAEKIQLQKLRAREVSDSIAKIQRKIVDSNRKHFVDSVKRLFSTDSLMRNISLTGLPTDSLQSMLSSVNNGTDLVNQEINNRVDSLKEKLSDPLSKISQKKDSLASKVEDLREDVEKRFGDNSVPLNEKASSIANGAQEKVSTQMKELGIEQVKVPGANRNVPEVNVSQMEDLELPGSDVNISKDVQTGLPNAGNIGTFNVGADIPAPNTDLSVDLDQKLNGKFAPEKLKEVSGKVGEINEALPPIKESAETLQKVKNGEALPEVGKKTESAVTQISEVKELSGEMNKLTKQQQEYQALVKKYRDQKLEKEELLRKTKNIANEKLNKYSPDVTKVTDKLSKARSVITTVEHARKFKFKFRENALKGKPFRERIVPGVSLQSTIREVYNMDIIPGIGYKISNTFSVGAEGSYRLAFNRAFNYWVETPDVYGVRLYNNTFISKGVFIRTEIERMRYNHFFHEKLKVEQHEQRATNLNFGIGKRYAISEKVNGTTLVFYRLEVEGHVPAVSKLFVRVGFELNTRKKRKLGLK